MASLFALAFGAEVAFVAASSLEVFADTAAAVPVPVFHGGEKYGPREIYLCG